MVVHTIFQGIELLVSSGLLVSSSSKAGTSVRVRCRLSYVYRGLD